MDKSFYPLPWWIHQMESFSALLALCTGNSPVTGEFPSQRPVTRIFDIFFDLRLNKRFCKQWWGWWFVTPSRPLWRHYKGQTKLSNIYWYIFLLVRNNGDPWQLFFHKIFGGITYVQLRDIASNRAKILVRCAMAKKNKNRNGLNKDEKWYCTFHIQSLSPVS